MKRISDAKYAPWWQGLHGSNPECRGHWGRTESRPAAIPRPAYIVDTYNSPGAGRPEQGFRTSVGSSGIFKCGRSFQANSDYRKNRRRDENWSSTATAAAGTIQMSGFDYHSGNRADGEAARFEPRQLQSAPVWNMRRRVGKPVMIYGLQPTVSLASNGMIDSSVGGRGKGRLEPPDNQSVAATYFLVYKPRRQSPLARAEQSGTELADRQFQSRRPRSITTGSPRRQTTCRTWCKWSFSITWHCTVPAPYIGLSRRCYPSAELEQLVGYRHGRLGAADRIPSRWPVWSTGKWPSRNYSHLPTVRRRTDREGISPALRP